MKRDKVLRHARFALAACCLLAAALIAGLWARSLHTKDILWIALDDSGKILRVSAMPGRFVGSVKSYGKGSRGSLLRLFHARRNTRSYTDDSGRAPHNGWFQILRWKSGLVEYHAPMWIVLLSLVAIAAAVSPRRRFSLRTLLIATTLLALLLGVATCWRPDIPPAGGRFGAADQNPAFLSRFSLRRNNLAAGPRTATEPTRRPTGNGPLYSG